MPPTPSSASPISPLDSKVELLSADVRAGGQVASAIVACQRWGLKTRYAGKVGEDDAAKFQIEEMKREGVEAHWVTATGCSSQIAYILVDDTSGERTVLWKRDPAIAMRPDEVRRDWISGARVLLVDGHDAAAATQAARWAREEAIPVIGDFDNLYPRVEGLLEYTDYPITSKDFPERLAGEKDLLKSLPRIHRDFKCCLIAATIGRLGVLAWDGEKFLLRPGFCINAIDTTGAGDIFHGAFAYGLVQGWPVNEILEFSCAAAALNCKAAGARGGIASIDEIQNLRRQGHRAELAYAEEELREAALAARTRNTK
ncbi:MAG: PfkB family carbohydrate kinase [Candidatus Acidiferrales bacterium]